MLPMLQSMNLVPTSTCRNMYAEKNGARPNSIRVPFLDAKIVRKLYRGSAESSRFTP